MHLLSPSNPDRRQYFGWTLSCIVGLLQWIMVSQNAQGQSGQTQTNLNRQLGLASMEVDVVVGAAEAEVTATMQFTLRAAAKNRRSYELFIPVHVPISKAKSPSLLRHVRPALSVERRPVILKRVSAPENTGSFPTIDGMAVVWWKAVLRWPRRGEPLIVDMRYPQKYGTSGKMKSCVYVPALPDGALSEESHLVMRTDLPGTALLARSGKVDGRKGLLSNWIRKVTRAKGKSLRFNLQHRQPIIVDLIAD